MDNLKRNRKNLADIFEGTIVGAASGLILTGVTYWPYATLAGLIVGAAVDVSRAYNRSAGPFQRF